MLWHKAIGAAGTGVAISNEGRVHGPVNANSLTVSSVSFGTAAANRRIIVALGLRTNSASSISSVTIGGVTADIDAVSSYTDVARFLVIASAIVPTGSSGNVVVALGSSSRSDGVHLTAWATYGTSFVQEDTASTGSGVATLAPSLSGVRAGNYLIGAGAGVNSGVAIGAGAGLTDATEVGSADYLVSGSNFDAVGGVMTASIEDVYLATLAEYGV